jgi:hypothetical protein
LIGRLSAISRKGLCAGAPLPTRAKTWRTFTGINKEFHIANKSAVRAGRGLGGARQEFFVRLNYVLQCSLTLADGSL